ncbi:MAG TPA: helix-turn-helix domain-containing protein [Streptosporangiaceae bacterium]|jgi:sugar-specific transcriptional regulator TrmB
MLEIAALSPAEEDIYLAVLSLPSFTPGDASQVCSEMSHAEMRATLDSLTDKGLLTLVSHRPRRYAPVGPEAALEGHLAKREEELRQARAMLTSLTERYRAVPRRCAADELVQIVTGGSRALQRWLSSLDSARSQVRVLNRPPFETESADPFPAELEALRRGIPVRAVYDDSGVRSPVVLARRRAEIAAGEQARITGKVPLHLLLVDDNLALMPLGHDRLRTDGLLVVHSGALLDALSALFELTWANALPLSLDTHPEAGEQPPALRDDTTRMILGLLAAGLPDLAIAGRLGCSERTVQRHILRLTEAVGARTRFQLALHIGARNWT